MNTTHPPHRPSNPHRNTMDTDTLIFATLTATLAGVTLHAWRLGNEKRDVALLGVFSGLLGMGTVVTTIV